MAKFQIEGTEVTPTVRIDDKKGSIEITGRSTMQDPVAFYSTLVERLSGYEEHNVVFRNVNIALTYFNTSSSKWIYQIFKSLENLYQKNNGMQINWFYDEDDETIQEAGEDYQSLLRIPFNMIEVK